MGWRHFVSEKQNPSRLGDERVFFAWEFLQQKIPNRG